MNELKQSIVYLGACRPRLRCGNRLLHEQGLLFRLVEDTYIPAQDKRWVLVAPPGSAGGSLLLARSSHEGQAAFIGSRTGPSHFLPPDG